MNNNILCSYYLNIHDQDQELGTRPSSPVSTSVISHCSTANCWLMSAIICSELNPAYLFPRHTLRPCLCLRLQACHYTVPHDQMYTPKRYHVIMAHCVQVFGHISADVLHLSHLFILHTITHHIQNTIVCLKSLKSGLYLFGTFHLLV